MGENQRLIFVKNLKQIMSARSISQADIVVALGVSSSTVSDWVKGKKYPRVDVLQALADYLGVLPSDLQSDKNSFEDELTEKEKRFLEAFTGLSPENRHTLLVLAEALLRDQSTHPAVQEQGSEK